VRNAGYVGQLPAHCPVTGGELRRLRYSSADIEQRVAAIRCRALAESLTFCEDSFGSFGDRDLAMLLRLYDRYFLDHFIRDACGGRLTARVSNRMTKTAGKITYARSTGPYTISLSKHLVLKAFSARHAPVTVNGVACRDRLGVVMRLLEHELVHLLELLLYGETSCAKQRFRRMSRDVFGHADVTHELLKQDRDPASVRCVCVGDHVRFQFRRRWLSGTVSRITRRATVLVAEHRRSSAGALVKTHTK
jgi:hypothetical protein